MDLEGRQCESFAEVPLCTLSTGGEGRLVALDMPVDQAHRLRQMGLCEGQRLSVIRAGRRMIVEAMDTRIGLDRDLAARLRVCIGDSAGSVELLMSERSP